MPLSAGTKLGPYEILEPIGAGGMGEVYRAHDPRMGRDVAIKISAERFSDRFSREVHAVAALNHPSICHLYDVGPDYLVMELVEGPTLAERIKQGAVPLADALGTAKQIADALEEAHEKGIVHRDLKPANVKIRPDGTVKVLDFGLAKRISEPSTEGSTMTMGVTEAGTAIGTPAYMAPEQAQGKEVDNRADVWAFGVLLYELLSSQRPFQGDSVQATMAAVLVKEPDLEKVPARVRRLLRACFKKDPRERLSNIGDWQLLLDEDDRTQHASPGAKSKGPWLVAAAALILTGVALWAPWRHAPGAEIGEPLVRIDADLGTGVSLFTENGPALALSGDGRRVVFSSRSEDGSMHLLWRRLDQANATALPGTESAFSPFFSPNGEQIAFFAEGSLKKVELATGNVTVLANAVNPAGGSWGEDGVIVFNRAPTLDLWTVRADGGDLKQIPRVPSDTHGRYWPQLLPGDKTLLFTSLTGTGGDVDQESVDALSLQSGYSRTLVRGAHFSRYLSNGYLAYLRRGTLFVRAFDAGRLELTGPEVPVLQGVEYSTLDGAGQFDVAANGTLIYRAARAGSELKTVQWMDSTGRLEPLLETPGDYRSIALSSDGKRLAVDIAEGAAGDLYVYDIARRQQPARLTVGAKSRGSEVAWTPDGRYLFFTASGAIWWVPSEGLSKPREFLKNCSVMSVSHDGKRLFVVTVTRETRGDTWIVPLLVNADGPQAGRPVPLLQGPFAEDPYDDSPDGRWLAYVTDETGNPQIYVLEMANPTHRWMLSAGSGRSAHWNPAGQEVFFSTFFAPLRIMVAPYSIEDGHFQPGQARQWSPVAIPGHAGFGSRGITMASDGKHFAVLMPAEQPLGNRVTFVMNFFDEVRRKVPTAR
jgi:Tol biopolymer transport system component